MKVERRKKRNKRKENLIKINLNAVTELMKKVKIFSMKRLFQVEVEDKLKQKLVIR